MFDVKMKKSHEHAMGRTVRRVFSPGPLGTTLNLFEGLTI